jgi:hypothetical protein
VPEWGLGKLDVEPYALTVVLEDKSEAQVKLYTQIRERVRERERERARARARG